MKVQEYITQYNSAKLPNADWLEKIRSTAINNFEELRFPAVKDEDWKYTRASNFIKDEFSLAEELYSIPTERIAKHILTDGELLVFVDGLFSDEHSKIDKIKTLSNSLDSDEVKQYLNTVVDANASGFVALNTAMMNDGLFFYIDGIIEKPIQVLNINSGEKIINHQRNLIIAKAHSQASIIETYVCLESDKKYFNNIVTEVIVMKNSQLNLYKIQNESDAAQHLNSVYVQQHRDSYFNHVSIDLGGKNVRNWLQSNLMESNASCNFDGLYLTSGEQHVDNHTRVEHQHAHTFSQENYKGILLDESRAVFNGQVYIAQDAQKVTADQRNANLLIGQGAIIDSKPQLEIYADDVKCTHGATIGRLDESALFYLLSRGIDKTMARNLLTYGFAHGIIEKIKPAVAQRYLSKKLLRWLPNGTQLENLL